MSARVWAQPFLDAKDLARLEGVSIARVRGWLRSGVGPESIVIRGRRVVTVEAAIAWLERRAAHRKVAA